MQALTLESSALSMNEREFKLFRSLVHQHAGIWLRDGKQIMLASRLSRRLRHYGLASFAEYYEYVQNLPDNRDEIRQLINCVTTNKTSFFREKHHFDYLADTIVPAIQAAALRGGSRNIRIWSAACSTGEEPYSIAITLLESLQRIYDRSAPKYKAPSTHPAASRSYSIEVVASDIDTAVLSTATRAIYSQDSLATIPRQIWGRYFLRGKDEMVRQVKVKPEVARLVGFQRINLMDSQWPLEGLFDVIFFRNALIYFQRKTQEMFLRKMIRYLKPAGHLFLGNAEHIPWMNDVLMPLNRTMYRLRENG